MLYQNSVTDILTAFLVQSLRGEHIPPALARSGRKMVERDYVISHIGGQPVYAREMVPESARADNRRSQSGMSSSSPTRRVDGLEGSLEREIEREGEREGERRERRREREDNGREWEHFKRRGRRERVDGERAGRSADDLRMVLSRDDMDGMTHDADEVGRGEGAATQSSTRVHLRMPAQPVRYRAVREEIPVAEYEAMTKGGPIPPGSDLAGKAAPQVLASPGESFGRSQMLRKPPVLAAPAQRLTTSDSAWQQQLAQVDQQVGYGDGEDGGYADVDRDLDGIY